LCIGIGRSTVRILCVAMATILIAGSASANTYIVNTAVDLPGVCAPSGVTTCSLRQAIASACANGQADTITFATPGVYPMAILPTGADDNDSGDFNVSTAGSILIDGGDSQNPANVVIDAAHVVPRIFTIAAGNITLRGVTLTNAGYALC